MTGGKREMIQERFRQVGRIVAASASLVLARRVLVWVL